MINGRLTSSIIRPKTILNAATTATTKKPDMVTRFMKNGLVGKICETAAENPVMCQSIFSLAICCGARPVTNMITTKDKKDASYASCHSISSGVMGFVWPLIFATPLAAAVKMIAAKPQKFLKPETIKKFYPTVGLETIMENGKKSLRVMTNAKGEMLRENGTKLLTNLEPLKLKGEAEAAEKIKKLTEKLAKAKSDKKKLKIQAQIEDFKIKQQEFEAEKAAFEAMNPKLYVDPENGVIRSREFFKTENGKFAVNKDNQKIGCAIQKPEDKNVLEEVLSGKKAAEINPITEEMEIGNNKEQNIKSIINWVPDILLAPPRAMLTIELIPRFLKLFGMEKQKKQAPQDSTQQKPNNTMAFKAASIKMPTFATLKAHSVSAPQKGGV